MKPKLKPRRVQAKVEFVDLTLRQVADICRQHGCGNCPLAYDSVQCRMADQLRGTIDRLNTSIVWPDKEGCDEN